MTKIVYLNIVVGRAHLFMTTMQHPLMISSSWITQSPDVNREPLGAVDRRHRSAAGDAAAATGVFSNVFSNVYCCSERK